MLTAIRRLTAWVLLLAGLGIAVLARDESASFQTCIGEHSVNVRNEQKPRSTNFLVHVFNRASVSFDCTGSFIDVNNSTITALATIAIAGFTLTLWRTTTKQERLTREALVTTTRAFVFLEDFDNNFVTTWQSGNPSISNFIIVARWKNSGDTPSKNLTISLNVLYVEGDLPPNFNFLFPTPPLRTLIGPKANEWNSPILIPDPEANEAFKGRTNIYVWGRADYQDIFGNTPRRFTEICYRIYFHQIQNEVNVQFVPYGDYNKSDYDL